MFRGLEHGCIARCECTDQGLEREHEGVIPWPDDQHAAQGIKPHLPLTRLLSKRNLHPLGAHPGSELLLCQIQLLSQGKQFKEGFCGWFAEICREGMEHIIFMFIQQGPETA